MKDETQIPLDKLKAASAMLAALEAIASVCEADDQYPYHTTQAAKAIVQAHNAGIVPTEGE